MTKIARLFLLCSLSACAVLGLAACGGAIPSNAVAVVGSIPITRGALAHWMTIAARSTTPKGAAVKAAVPDPPNYTNCIAYLRSDEHAVAPIARTSTAKLKNECAKDYKSDKETALGFLLSADTVIGEAAELQASVSGAELEKEFLKTKKKDYPSEAAFHTYLAETGYTVSDLKLKLETEELLPGRIEGAYIAKAEQAITKAVIARYYKNHSSAYHKRNGASLYILLVHTKAEAEAAKAKVESGKSFASVAKPISVLHTAQDGGVYLTTEEGKEEEDLNRAIFARGVRKDVPTGPVRTTDGYYVFELKTTSPAHEESLSQAQDEIRAKLTIKQIEHDLSVAPAQLKAKWKAKTDCRPGYVVSLCKQSKA